MGISGLRLELDKNKQARLRWAKEHLGWTMEDWYRVIWTDEATFETRLDTRSCYVTRKHGTAMESRYLKPTFKSVRSSIGIWRAITLGSKGPVHFLQKDRRMNSEIYINQVLKELGLPFFKRCVEERGDMIWMDDGAQYHTSRMTTKWCHKIRSFTHVMASPVTRPKPHRESMVHYQDKG